MNENKEAKLLDHEYDGIQELDNPLPNWWLTTFYGAIIFAVIYFAYYHLGNGPSLEQELHADMDAIRILKQSHLQKNAGPSEADLMVVFQDSAKRESGKTIFAEKCATCHGFNGEGQIGPNLTDKFWIHGNGSLTGIFTVVSEGIAEKGMPPWKAMLKPDEIYAVVAYAKSLQGTNPAKPKAPQGIEVNIQ